MKYLESFLCYAIVILAQVPFWGLIWFLYWRTQF